jgi:hypothetical protein
MARVGRADQYPASMSNHRRPFTALALLGALAPVGFAAGAPDLTPVNRPLNLPQNTAELGLGAGFGHRSPDGDNGLGLNLELGYGLLPRLEVNLRTGLRFAEAGRAVKADEYGRPVETETHNAGHATVANPEVRLRMHLVRRQKFELALDAGAQLPVDAPGGAVVGLPLAVRFSPRVRLDSGVFLPVRFYDDPAVDVSLPLHLWIQLTDGSFAAPITGLVWQNDAEPRIPFGLALAFSLLPTTELSAWFLFRDLNASTRDDVGGGLAVYLRF